MQLLKRIEGKVDANKKTLENLQNEFSNFQTWKEEIEKWKNSIQMPPMSARPRTPRCPGRRSNRSKTLSSDDGPSSPVDNQTFQVQDDKLQSDQIDDFQFNDFQFNDFQNDDQDAHLGFKNENFATSGATNKRGARSTRPKKTKMSTCGQSSSRATSAKKKDKKFKNLGEGKPNTRHGKISRKTTAGSIESSSSFSEKPRSRRRHLNLPRLLGHDGY